MRVRKHVRATVVLATAGLLALSGCAKSERDSGGSGGTFVFAGSSDPQTLDPFYASDGESFRPARQIFEGLVGTKPGTADPAPLLATSWKQNPNGKEFTFTLRRGVKFQDGTPFDAKAACWNFDRWYNTPPGINQSDTRSYYYQTLFGGFKTGPKAKAALYQSCTTKGDDTITVTLSRPFASFVAAMSLPAFSMQSPTAIQKYGTTSGDQSQDAYALKHPTGTGPFTFESWTRGDAVTLKRNPDYWGEKAHVDEVQIIPIADPAAAAQALQNGDIDGYDLVSPADIGPLKEAGYQVVGRPAFNVLYLGFNQKTKALSDIRVRQAIAYAIDKQAVIKASMPPGTKVADEFMPSLVNGWTPDVTKYPYNPAKAKQLLKQAGVEGLTLRFNYPTDVTRPYMPSPSATFNIMRQELQKVGIKIVPVADKWDPDYLDKIQGSANHDLHLLGWTGDYNDPDNFLGVFFGAPTAEWGFNNPQLFKALSDARGIPSLSQQKSAYEKINKQVMDFLPGIPVASPVPSLAFSPDVKGFRPSPVQDEPWNTISLN